MPWTKCKGLFKVAKYACHSKWEAYAKIWKGGWKFEINLRSCCCSGGDGKHFIENRHLRLRERGRETDGTLKCRIMQRWPEAQRLLSHGRLNDEWENNLGNRSGIEYADRRSILQHLLV